jgi:hypothetical protein
MNEQPIIPKKPEQAMEGRFVDAKKVDHGDRHFHEVGMATTPEAEQEDLEALRVYIQCLPTGG